MERIPFDYSPDGMSAKKVLTDIVSKDLPTSYPSEYFTMLWSAIDSNIKSSILDPASKNPNGLSAKDQKRLGIGGVWDVVRFTLKGGTSILQAINFILDLEGRDVDIEKIRDNWENSDWDSMVLINPELPENVYFEAAKTCYSQIFFVSARFKTLFDWYLRGNSGKYQFDLSPDEIAKMYPASKWETSRKPKSPGDALREANKVVGNITSVRASLAYGISDVFREYLRDDRFKNAARDDNTKQRAWKAAENNFSIELLDYFKSKPKAQREQTHLIESNNYQNGLTAITIHTVNNGYLRESLNRTIKVDVTKSPDERFFNYNFDLYRLMIPFELIITTRDRKQFNSIQYSELIDITFIYRDIEKFFNKLTVESILPTVGLPTKRGKEKIRRRNYPSVGVEYNIDDVIRVINTAGNEDGKLAKRCRRTLAMLKIKCKEEKEYRPDRVQDESRCSPKIPREINEETCRANPNLQIDWGVCLDSDGRPMSKNQLIEWFYEEFREAKRSMGKERLAEFKKVYLCNIYRRYRKWKAQYPDIANRLIPLLKQIFVIYEKELELRPKLVNQAVDLPANLMDVLLMRNVFIDLEFRDFLYGVKEILVGRLVGAYNEIEKMLDPDRFEGIYVSGGSAYTLLHEFVKNNLSRSGISVNIGPPYKSFDFDSSVFTTVPCPQLESTDDFENTISILIDNIQLSGQEVTRINGLSPRFKIASKANLQDVEDKWHYKYLSNLIAPTEVYEGKGSEYTFLSLDRFSNTIAVRLNMIVYDVAHNFYRMEHFVELFFRCGPALPGYKKGHYWLLSPSGLKFAAPDQLFKQNHTAMVSRRENHNVKWAIDRERLIYLCNLENIYSDKLGVNLLSGPQYAECTNVARLAGEADRKFRKEQEYMTAFIREKNLQPKAEIEIQPQRRRQESQKRRREEGRDYLEQRLQRLPKKFGPPPQPSGQQNRLLPMQFGPPPQSSQTRRES